MNIEEGRTQWRLAIAEVIVLALFLLVAAKATPDSLPRSQPQPGVLVDTAITNQDPQKNSSIFVLSPKNKYQTSSTLNSVLNYQTSGDY